MGKNQRPMDAPEPAARWAGWVLGVALTAGLVVLSYLLDNVAGVVALLLIVAVGGGTLAISSALVPGADPSKEPGLRLLTTPKRPEVFSGMTDASDPEPTPVPDAPRRTHPANDDASTAS